jgi:hypothetical protein
MKATKIYYEELRTFGSYNNRKVGIELEVEAGEKAADVMAKARIFVQSSLSGDNLSPHLLESVIRSVKNAQQAIEDFSNKTQESLRLEDEIPF